MKDHIYNYGIGNYIPSRTCTSNLLLKLTNVHEYDI